MTHCTVPVHDNSASGDDLYRPLICPQPFIDYFWNTYGFNENKDYWTHGFGWDDPCNTDLPLARTFNACWALTYSADDYLNDNWDAPQNILQWGRRHVRENIDDLRSLCGDGSATAKSFTGTFVDDHVDLYLGFFYSEDVPSRAATLIHEARHQAGKDHNANFPAGSVFGAGQRKCRFGLELSRCLDLRRGIPLVVLRRRCPHDLRDAAACPSTRESHYRQRVRDSSWLQYLEPRPHIEKDISEFLQTIITRVDANDYIFKRILDDEDFRGALGDFYLHKVYERLRAGAA